MEIPTDDESISSSHHSAIASTSSKIILLRCVYVGATEWIGLIFKEGQIKQFHRERLHQVHPGSCAYMGKIIYMLGEEKNRVQYVHQLDTKFPSIWQLKRCANMLTRRSKPHTAVLRGKLFVLGDDRGFDYKENGPWGEVYDPARDEWHPLPTPKGADKYRYSPMMTAVLHSEDKILLSFTFSRDLLAFNVEEEKWDIYHRLDNSLPFSGRAIAVDGVLYRCEAGVLYAYKLATRLTLHITFAKMALTTTTTQFDLPSDVNPSLHHLSDDFFCLIWRAVNGSINFVKFQLSICFNLNLKPYLHSSISSIDCYVPDLLPEWQLADSLMLDGLMESFDNYNEAKDMRYVVFIIAVLFVCGCLLLIFSYHRK